MYTDKVIDPSAAEPRLIAEKLAEFDRIRADLHASFTYVQEVHGQRCFASFPVAYTVRYLHALWICECKDMLLSVPRSRSRYEGHRALELLRDWQAGETADVVALLEEKLELLPFLEITRGVQAAVRGRNRARVQRLGHGRGVLLNRARNLGLALEAIFEPSPEQLNHKVREASMQYGHTVEQCAAQLAEMQTPLYGYVRHPALARRNMLVMNMLGIAIADNDADRPGRRTAYVQIPILPHRPYAEHVIMGETTLALESQVRDRATTVENRRAYGCEADARRRGGIGVKL
jgi:hypothetical protein